MAAVFRLDNAVPFKKVSIVNLGGVPVRFLSVNDDTKAADFPQDLYNCQGALLFLACDVLSGTSILKKNFIRVHGRFSKIGVAAKVKLKGFKLDGINNSGVIWFYNIKGLFRVAFELGSESFQRDCLALLQSEWLKRFNDPTLKPDWTIHLPPVVTADGGFPGLGQASIASGETISMYAYNDITLNMKSEQENLNKSEDEEQETIGMESLNQLTDNNSNTKTENVNESFTHNESRNTEKQTNIFVLDTQDPCNMYEQDLLSERNQDTCTINNDENDIFQETITAEELETNETNEGLENETEMWKSLTAEVFLQKLDVFLKDCLSMSSDSLLQCVTSNVLVTVKFLQSLLNTSKDISLEDGLTVFKLIDQCSCLINAGHVDTSLVNTFGISRVKFLFLYVLSDWLGEEFHKLETEISEKVEIFKKQNIQNIANLPSPEETINLLFPAFMKVLITNWLGEKHEAYPSDMDLSDHDYCYNEQKTKDKTQRFLLVQLILEFATNSLISGITHVVIAKLKSQNLL